MLVWPAEDRSGYPQGWRRRSHDEAVFALCERAVLWAGSTLAVAAAAPLAHSVGEIAPRKSSDAVTVELTRGALKPLSLTGETLRGKCQGTCWVIGNIWHLLGTGPASGPYSGTFHFYVYLRAGRPCFISTLHNQGFTITSGAYSFSGNAPGGDTCHDVHYSASVAENGHGVGKTSGILNIVHFSGHRFVVVFR
jgi:hypothetical protein